jgi:hypothetical protein
MLSNGEFVVNAKSTSQNLGLLHAINSGVQKFADGGVATRFKGLGDTAGNIRHWAQGINHELVATLRALAHTLQQQLRAQARANASGGGGPGLSNGTKGVYERYAFSLFPRYGWGSNQRGPLINLWNQESGWNPTARNPSSGAYGIPQALPASKIPGGYHSTPGAQIRWGESYIKSAYGSPANAWSHEIAHNWYDNGGVLQPHSVGINHSGRPEAVFTEHQWSILEKLIAEGAHARSRGDAHHIAKELAKVLHNMEIRLRDENHGPGRRAYMQIARSFDSEF